MKVKIFRQWRVCQVGSCSDWYGVECVSHSPLPSVGVGIYWYMYSVKWWGYFEAFLRKWLCVCFWCVCTCVCVLCCMPVRSCGTNHFWCVIYWNSKWDLFVSLYCLVYFHYLPLLLIYLIGLWPLQTTPRICWPCNCHSYACSYLSSTNCYDDINDW